MISSSAVAHCVWGFFSDRLIDSTGRRGTFQRCVIVRPSLRESSYGVWAWSQWAWRCLCFAVVVNKK